ncbi:hypothetical protein TRFO_31136 [Tritrichomonas foetus]|uniref:Uncharacterized protein n=1 Tax=Tritrichomonas foetus TaxID=1144522 RepID=A0A1J4JWN2_9EUKA|nr:hypothetical protein TRFO_31136 [Tritrichomonas foetus]|eukprot:OHT01942.1 hypothetical protein TRFO_31136 [Tritrichomonas foetus]
MIFHFLINYHSKSSQFISFMGNLFSRPFFAITPKNNKPQTLPDCILSSNKEMKAKEELHKRHSPQKRQDTTTNIILASDEMDSEENADEINWDEIDTITFLPPENPKLNSNFDSEIYEPSELDEKLVFDILSGHLSRFCEDELKCSLDELLKEFERSNSSTSEDTAKNQKELMSKKIQSIQKMILQPT